VFIKKKKKVLLLFFEKQASFWLVAEGGAAGRSVISGDTEKLLGRAAFDTLIIKAQEAN
jgi:hypothetical protein